MPLNNMRRPAPGQGAGLLKPSASQQLFDNDTAANGQAHLDTLAVALQLAAEGFHVFPLTAGQKSPPAIDGFQRRASKTADQIRKWFVDPVMGFEQPYNIGISTSRFGDNDALIVVDVDNKGAVCGDNTVLELELAGHILPPTREHRTPTGGRHLIYSASHPVRQGAGVLGPGVDIRSKGGYIVGPGSTVAAGGYTVADRRPIAAAPEWLIAACGHVRERGPTNAPVDAVDPQRALQRAEAYLTEEAPTTYAGFRNEIAYRVTQRVKDLGVAEPDAPVLLAEWNLRNSPPLDPTELENVVANAYHYGQEPVGCSAPEAQFPNDLPVDKGPLHRGFRLLSLDEMLATPRPPDWLVHGYLERHSLGMLFGASGSMKSFLALDIGLSVAAGVPWNGRSIQARGPVVYLAGEGFHGLSRRIRAWMLYREIEGPLPFFVSNQAVGFLDSAKDFNTAVQELAAVHGKPHLVIVDTLARCFGAGDENSTQDMSAFVASMDAMRAAYRCAVLLIHHSGLQNGERARGASALRAGLDVEYRLDVSGNARVLVCTKAKDTEPPPDLALAPVEIDCGWIDPTTGESIKSIVLERCSRPRIESKALKGAARIAFAALQTEAAAAEGGKVHEDIWRRAAYQAGVTTGGSDSKRKAFGRAVRDLLDAKRIATENDFYWPMA